MSTFFGLRTSQSSTRWVPMGTDDALKALWESGNPGSLVDMLRLRREEALALLIHVLRLVSEHVCLLRDAESIVECYLWQERP